MTRVALQQDPVAPTQRPTVGDTVSVVHRIAVSPGTLVEARAPTDTNLATLMGPPSVTREGDSVRIAYTISVWAPGRHDLVIPGAVTVTGDGTVDTLPDAVVVLDVASVLPVGAEVESLSPQSARPWVERTTPSGWPLLVTVVPVFLLLATAAWLWRRRGRAVAAMASAQGIITDHRTRLQRLIEAGEASLAIDHLLTLLPDSDATSAWRTEVQAVRFDPSRTGRLIELVDEGLTLYEGTGSPE